MKNIVPYLWYDKEAVEAVTWYISLFENAKIINKNSLSDTPSGDVEMIDFQIENLKISAMSAGPYFHLNNAISLMVSCESEAEVDRLYEALSKGGTDLMPLDEYPFSKRYAWVQDRYGLNWQLFMTDQIQNNQRIRPTLLFQADVCGQVEDAMSFYESVFEETQRGYVNYYGQGEAADVRAKINYAEFNIAQLPFVMMDHGMGGDERFNEAFSFVIECENQEEIDYYWSKLSHSPEDEQCGWVKDQFGISWQIVPIVLDDMLFKGTKEESKRVAEAFMQMKKLDIKALKLAQKGSE